MVKAQTKAHSDVARPFINEYIDLLENINMSTGG